MSSENPEEVQAADLTDYEYTVMITLLRIYDAIGVLLEESFPGSAEKLAAIHKDGSLLMPEPSINGNFGEGFTK